MMKNILTVDLEDWFVVENLRGSVSSQDWDKLPSRVEETTEAVLALFDDYGVRATFFVLGLIAEKHPALIQAIASKGHEIACHSYRHGRIDLLTEERFREDTSKAVKAIEKACGETPLGYRAPSWSIGSRTPWAFEVLADLGFVYDSSIYPIKHDVYGEPEGPRKIFKTRLESGRSIYEIPATTVSILGRNFPVGGGGYLRHSPFWFTRKMMNKLNRNKRPAVIYIHPWEFDNNQPRLKGLSFLQRYRQYGSVITLQRKMELLLKKFDFCPALEYIRNLARKPIGFGR